MAVGLEKRASIMADDQVSLSFNNDVFTIVSGSDAGQQANYSGSVTVDYTTGSYSGLNFHVQGFGDKSGFGDSGGNYGGTLGVSGNNYAVTGGGFSLYWTSMTPSTARAVLVANGNDTYDTQANPTNAQSQPVSSTVDSSSSDAAVCFAQGTRVATAHGEVAVEQLAIGDLVVTASGTHRQVCWLGHRTIDCGRHPSPHEVMPVRVAAHAFAAGRPARDLVLSPGHAICVDAVGDVLIPAAALVNGTTIVQEQVESVTYWHVELEGGHNVVFAENLPCESYLDMDNRDFFAEAGVTALHAIPDGRAVTHADFCRPFHQDGPVVAFVRERLAARAPDLGWRLEQAPFADLHLIVDGQRVEPETSELAARFVVPAGAEEVWLMSDTSVPAEIGLAPDLRALGVCVGRLVVDDGFGSPRTILADDPLLCVGFHHLEDGPQRWTAGRARLAAELWQGCRGSFFLRVELTRPALPCWVAPVSDADEVAPFALAG